MTRYFAALLVVMLAVGSASVMACPGEKGKTIDGTLDSTQSSSQGTRT